MDTVTEAQCSRRQPIDQVQLRKVLEWELSLDARDLRSHAWYHGAISRAKAEEIVGERDGDFLVRDCTSQPGNYVLSCRSKGQNLHFVINKIILQPDTVYESIQYRFEDDGFDAVPDLITYYVGSGKPITVGSAAKILNPRNRRHPLSFFNVQRYETRSAAAAAAIAKTLRSYSSRDATGDGANDRIAAGSVHRPHETCDDALSRDSNTSFDGWFSNSLPRQAPPTPPSPAPAPAPICGARARSVFTEPPLNLQSIDANANANAEGFEFHGGGGNPLRYNCTDDYANVNNGAGGDDDCGDACTKPPPKPGRCTIEGDFGGTRHHETSPPTPAPKAVAVAAAAAAAPDGARKRCSLYAACSSDSGNGSDDSARSCNPIDATATAAAAAAAAAGTDDGNSSPSSVHSTRSNRRTTAGVVIKNPKYSYDGHDHGHQHYDRRDTPTAISPSPSPSLSPSRERRHVAQDERAATFSYEYDSIRCTSVVDLASASAFDLDAFHTLLLPMCENKPLDTCALQGLHMLLMDSGSRMLANHLTRADLELTVCDFERRHQQPSSPSPSPPSAHLMCRSGIELSLLPQGRQRRFDLIERSECLRLLVAITILTCATELERAELLNKWIEVAIDTKTALGNLFGFCAIMLGLCTPQVQRLNETWHILRQRYTDSAFNFEAKLRPTLKCMNESTNPLAPNTTIPHLLPVILLYERYHRHISDFGGVNENSDNREHDEHDADADADALCRVLAQNSHISNVCIDQWETCSPDLGLGILYSHLNATRQFHNRNQLATFRRNAEIVLTDTKTDQLLSDMFRTEFHLKFLWGSRGAKVNAAERYFKFQRVLDVMSQKCETIDHDDHDRYDSNVDGADADADGHGTPFADSNTYRGDSSATSV